MTSRFSFGYSAVLLLSACGPSAPKEAADSATTSVAAVVPPLPDTMALRDSAEATIAQLLPKPATAVFQEVVVRFPSGDSGASTVPVVCGTIRGKPGIGGSAGPTRFIYQSRWTVFVEDATNGPKFADLWGRLCQVKDSATP